MPIRIAIALNKYYVISASVILMMFAAYTPQAQAGVIFEETWESVSLFDPIDLGFFVVHDPTLPSGWRRKTPVRGESRILSMAEGNRFSQFGPLAHPAGGEQALMLSGRNTGVFIESSVVEANTSYTLSAAIGSSLDTLEVNDRWSLQLWADTSGNGSITSDDLFLGQSFGTLAGVSNPSRGDWALNSISFDSSDVSMAIGSNLIIFLNNFDNGTSYYDNVTLSSFANATVPEPTSCAVFLIGTMFTIGRRRPLSQA